MRTTIQVRNLDPDTVAQFKSALETLKASEEEVKELVTEINSAEGDLGIALDLAKEIHSSNVDLITYCKGNISAAGMILAAAGKPGHRFAELSTSFILNSQDPKPGRFRKVDNSDAEVIGLILERFQVKKRVLKEMLGTRHIISAATAYNAKIIDKIDDFKSKYEKEKPKKEMVTTEEVS